MADTATKSGAKTTIEDAGPCRKKLSIEISAERVSEKIKESFEAVAQQATLPGFRPGKAPRKLIERRFGKAAREEARSELASAAVQEAIKEHNLQVLGDPEGGDELADADLSGDKPIKFTFEVEVAPEFDLPALTEVEIKKPIIDVTEEMANKEVERMCVNEGDLTDVEGAAEAGDYLVGRGVLTRDRDGEVIHDIEGAVIRRSSDPKEKVGMALGVKVDDFEKKVGSSKAGDEIVFKATVADQHEVEAIRNEPVTITFTVTGVHRIKPLDVAQLLERYGMESEQQLREAIMLKLNQRVLVEQQSAMREQLARHLLDAIQFELPKKVTANQAERNIQRRRFELMYQGVDAEEIDKQMDELRSSSNDTAQRELKLFFILGKAANDRQIPVTEPEVNGRIAQMAAETGQRPDQLRAELLRSGRVHAIAQQIREHKTLDSLLSEVKTVDTLLEEFNAWMKKQSAGKSK